jgi:hypothetical protein
MPKAGAGTWCLLSNTERMHLDDFTFAGTISRNELLRAACDFVAG